MAVKADWFDSLESTDAGIDPFAQASSALVDDLPVIAISMEDSDDELRAHLRTLIDREGRLSACGITCRLKELPDMTCLGCPVSKAGDKNDAMSVLCRIGRDQETVASMLIAKSHSVN